MGCSGGRRTPSVSSRGSVASYLIYADVRFHTLMTQIVNRPSFHDGETVQANVRVLNDGETVSIDGTHLGHNIPDVPGVNR